MPIVQKIRSLAHEHLFALAHQAKKNTPIANSKPSRMLRLSILAVALTGASAATHATEPKINNEAEAVKALGQFIKERQLTSLTIECLRFDVSEPDKQTYVINVREYHDAICGGDPKTSPRLFSARVEKMNGAITADANSRQR